MRTALIIIILFPPALGFYMGAGARGLAVLGVLGAVLAGAYALLLGACTLAGEADDQAGIPRG